MAGGRKRPPKKDDQGASERHHVGDRFARVTVPPGIGDPRQRKAWGMPEDERERGHYVIELNLQHHGGLPGAERALRSLFDDPDLPDPEEARLKKVAKTYFGCRLSVQEVKDLAARDEARAEELARRQAEDQAAATAEAPAGARPAEPPGAGRAGRHRAIFRIWPDFRIRGQIDRSLPTVKADAASRAFGAEGRGIVWAVLDSGVDARHPHFGAGAVAADVTRAVPGHTLLDDSIASLHRCFCEVTRKLGNVPVSDHLPDPDDGTAGDEAERERRIRAHLEAALGDDFGHGTHVAGIIAGGLREGVRVLALERQFKAGASQDAGGAAGKPGYGARAITDVERVHGVARECKIVSLRVLDEEGDGRTSDVLRALEYIREKINDDPKFLRVQGVNLSVGYEFDPELFACGQSPICAEVDRLVQAGVVVVTAAGNTGFGAVSADQRVTKVGLSNTINDPGNAALAITVGATHRDAPHTYGVSYFSSKGPTGDGRLKPDLVAPGERITSCAAGKKLEAAKEAGFPLPEDGTALYVDDSGTSMAAPHVSGAVAAFLSIRREFIGKPLEVKRIFLESATSLGRERYFEGHGLVDLMRAIQRV